MKVKVIASHLDGVGAENQTIAGMVESDINAFLATLPADARILHVTTALCSVMESDFDAPMHVTTIWYEA